MKAKQFFIISVLMCLHGLASAQFDVEDEIRQQLQREVDKLTKEAESLLYQQPIIQPDTVVIPAHSLEESLMHPVRHVMLSNRRTLELLFNNLSRVQSNNLLFVKIGGMATIHKTVCLLVHGLQPTKVLVVKVPANVKGMPSIMFMAHTDVDTVHNGNGNGTEALCSSTTMLGILDSIIYGDIKHGDVYFCVFKERSYMLKSRNILLLDTIMGEDDANMMVFLIGGQPNSYASNNVLKTQTSALMDIALSDNKMEWKVTSLKSAWDKLPIPVLQLYCGALNADTQQERVQIDDVMNAVHLGISIVANMGYMYK